MARNRRKTDPIVVIAWIFGVSIASWFIIGGLVVGHAIRGTP